MKLLSLSPRTPSSLLFSIQRSIFQSDIELVKRREGLVLHWYADSLGKKTGGYGHLYRKGDPDSFTQETANEWLEGDIEKARQAARKQFDQLPIQTQSLLDVLVSVNYQLGTAWYKDFKNTWALMLAGDYPKAAANAQMSKWFNQTPVRVKDFQSALQEAFLLNRQYQDLGL